MDSSIIPTRIPGVDLVSTTDFFFPIVDDPYMQGKVACANVLSDLYAMGVAECDNMLMLLGVSRKMETEQGEIVTRKIIEGFVDLAREAGTIVSGGQTVMNPWPLIGGVAMATCRKEDYILPVSAQVGDVLVLTKPLGTQIAANVNNWLYMPEQWKRVEHVLSKEEGLAAYEFSMRQMARLNRTAAQLMKKYKAHAATDVTGFGILGHARNLAGNQVDSVHFRIHTLPIIHKMKEVALEKPGFRLLEGFSAETSGGLLMALPPNEAQQLIEEFKSIEGRTAWIVGDVLEGPRTADVVENVVTIDVPSDE
eukprot:TRINITY_DN21923_c0_g1_i1.p1 TRINITY_DN21923_c0_g1~~TRINITY_DN21923_c0_g1_i1.p1  ORF type:complete len:309 (+),score=69.58 TRINITY_DN21923_c0_g1_i1:221-1147(+)